jgi:DNA-directed RNA polymerase sigma subunit (sigma70/sigma32)
MPSSHRTIYPILTLTPLSRSLRLPVHIHDLMVSLGRVERHFVAQNSRKPSPEELAERLALPLPKVGD